MRNSHHELHVVDMAPYYEVLKRKLGQAADVAKLAAMRYERAGFGAAF